MSCTIYSFYFIENTLMLSKILNVLLVIAGLALIGNYIYRRPKYDDGEKAPDFSATLIDGSPFELKSLRGNYVLLDFWGSWCGPCRRENPELVHLFNTHRNGLYGDKGEQFHMVSVGIETKRARWENAIKQDGLSWPYHIIQEERFKSPIAVQYGVREIPTKYLIDPQGNILLVNPSVAEIDTYLSKRKK